MKQISRFAAAFCATLMLVGVAVADPFRVKDLVVDKVAPTAPEASQQGKDEARLAGAQRLLDRLTLPEDVAAARERPDPLAISRMFVSSQSQGEMKTTPIAGGFRATGVVIWNYRANEVRAYLDARGIPFVDTQAGLAMVVPVAVNGVDPSQWGAQWTMPSSAAPSAPLIGKSDDTVLTPYIGSTNAWNRRPTWMEIQEELTATKADRGVIAEAYQQGAQYYVRLIDMRANIPDPNIGVAGPFVSLQSAQQGAVAAMERAWKVASIVRTSGSTSLSLTASFTDIQQWVKIRKSLEGSRLVKDLNIESLSNIGADIRFVYAGRPEQLAADLRSRGVDLRNADGGWLLQVSAPQ